jgi:hypothetical protein
MIKDIKILIMKMKTQLHYQDVIDEFKDIVMKYKLESEYILSFIRCETVPRFIKNYINNEKIFTVFKIDSMDNYMSFDLKNDVSYYFDDNDYHFLVSNIIPNYSCSIKTMELTINKNYFDNL